ncbi:MAG: hypothetical protein SPH83_10505 [Treponema sp.]|nr:hypothetical protein [Spirochaetales bacterium]MDY6190910.1 hypothetical protein [Treponema sp.]
MKKNNMFFYLTAYLALLIPAPGRFVYGFTLMTEVFLLSIIGGLSVLLIEKIKFDQLKSTLFILILVAFSILFRQILIIINSQVALTLGFVVFFPPVSLFILNILFTLKTEKFLVQFRHRIVKMLIFTLGGMMIFLIRDILGYGTFTFFGKNHFIYEKVLFDSNKIGVFSLLASIPGVLVILGIIYFLFIQFSKKFEILKNKE